MYSQPLHNLFTGLSGSRSFVISSATVGQPSASAPADDSCRCTTFQIDNAGSPAVNDKRSTQDDRKPPNKEQTVAIAGSQPRTAAEAPSDAQPLHKFKPKGVQKLHPSFFDDLPTQYRDNAHRRRHLGYNVVLQPPLRDPLKDINDANDTNDTRPHYPTSGPSDYQWPGPANIHSARQVYHPNGDGEFDMMYCCVRAIAMYELCGHTSSLKRLMTVKPLNSRGEVKSRASGHSEAQSNQYSSGHLKLRPACLQKRCKNFLPYKRQVEGMCTRCRDAGHTPETLLRLKQEQDDRLQALIKSFEARAGLNQKGDDPKISHYIQELEQFTLGNSTYQDSREIAMPAGLTDNNEMVRTFHFPGICPANKQVKGYLSSGGETSGWCSSSTSEFKSGQKAHETAADIQYYQQRFGLQPLVVEWQRNNDIQLNRLMEKQDLDPFKVASYRTQERRLRKRASGGQLRRPDIGALISFKDFKAKNSTQK